MRAGLNYATQGGSAWCYGNGGAVGHLLGRLGDECDTYAEISLSQEVYNKANNKFTVHTLVAYGTYEAGAGVEQYDMQGNAAQWNGKPGGRNGWLGQGGWAGQHMSLREAWAGYEMPSGMQLWAGKRFYQRKDIHIMDYYYLNNSGYGFGLENVSLGNNLGSLSFALIKHQIDLNEESSFEALNSYTFDARWNGISMWSDASLDIALLYSWENLSESQKNKTPEEVGLGGGYPGTMRANHGFLAMIEYTQGNFFGGFNKLSFTYGLNGYDYVGSLSVGGNHAGDFTVPFQERGQGYRLIDWGVIEQAKWNLGYAFIATHKNAADLFGSMEKGANWSHPTGNDYSIVLRPSYKWSDYTSTVLEFGYTNQKNHGWTGLWQVQNDKDRVSATKVTLAQQWSPSTQFWARPSIRLFATWFSGDLIDNRKTGLEDNHEVILGAQVEAWW